MVTTNISLQIISATTLLHSQSKTTFSDDTCFYIHYNKYDYDHELFVQGFIHVYCQGTTSLGKLNHSDQSWTTKESLNDHPVHQIIR